MGKMSMCSFKSPCGKLVGVVHGDDNLLAGPRSLVDAARKTLRKRYETREQMMGAGPTGASEIVMLNRRAQWTEEGIRVSLDPRHVKEIIEELGLEGAKPAGTPMIVSQSGKMDSDSRASSLRDATLYSEACGQVETLGNGSPRHSPRCINLGKSRIEPERCGHGRAREGGAISDQATDHLDALQMESAIRPHHGIH